VQRAGIQYCCLQPDIATACGLAGAGVAGAYAYAAYIDYVEKEKAVRVKIDDFAAEFSRSPLSHRREYTNFVRASETLYHHRDSSRFMRNSVCGVLGGVTMILSYRLGWKAMAFVGFTTVLASALSELMHRLDKKQHHSARFIESAQALSSALGHEHSD